MRILFTSEAVVEICNGKYHESNSNTFIERYSYFGDVVFASYQKRVRVSGQSVLNIEGVQFEFFFKETSLIGKIRNGRVNDTHMKECAKNVDIVVAHLPSPIGMRAIKYAKQYHKPYFIAVVGCAWDAYWNYNIKGKLIALPSFLSMRRVVKNARYALYVTQSFLQGRYPCPGITVGCSNVEISKPSVTVLDNRIQKIESLTDKDSINIVTVAAVNVRYKGQEFVIRALEKLKKQHGRKYHYYLIGGGDNSFLMNLSTKLGVNEYVHFIGSVPHEKVAEYLDNMDVYIQPSKQEGLPRALVEAMSRALPAFGSTTAGIPELLENDCIFSNGNVNEIVSLLEHISTDRLKELAKRSYTKSLEYTTDVLSLRRKNFFDAISNDIKK